jgi:hypothetical protein
MALDAMRSLWLGAPVGDESWATLVWSLGIVAALAPAALAGYWRGAER